VTSDISHQIARSGAKGALAPFISSSARHTLLVEDGPIVQADKSESESCIMCISWFPSYLGTRSDMFQAHRGEVLVVLEVSITYLKPSGPLLSAYSAITVRPRRYMYI
jgi:hypothetical protein